MVYSLFVKIFLSFSANFYCFFDLALNLFYFPLIFSNLLCFLLVTCTPHPCPFRTHTEGESKALFERPVQPVIFLYNNNLPPS